MARVMFIQFFHMEQLGLMYLSSTLKAHGHEVNVAMGKDRHIYERIRSFEPDVVGFTCYTGQEEWILPKFKAIKEESRKPVITILGGTHPTICPEIIEDPAVDAICSGEGERAILALANALDAREDYTKIPSLSVKLGEQTIVNPQLPLNQDLDSIPFADRELYKDYPFVHHNPTKHLLGTRGCFFKCTFCFHNAMTPTVEDGGRYLRLRSVDNVMEEIEHIRSQHNFNTFFFRDSIFANKRSWAREFLARYGSDVKAPFYAHTLASLLDEELVTSLKAAGCYLVAFGIECGNEEYRMNQLVKRVTDAQIRAAAKVLHRHDLPFYTTNMLGLPGERLDQALETVKLNLEIKPFTAWYAVFVPFPDHELTEYAKEIGSFNGESVTLEKSSSYARSMLRQPDIEQVENLHKLTYLLHLFPWLLPVVRWLIRLPYNRAFVALHKVTYLSVFVRKCRMWSFRQFLKEAWVALLYYGYKGGSGKGLPERQEEGGESALLYATSNEPS